MNCEPIILSGLGIKIALSELLKKLQTGAKRPDIKAVAELTLEKVNNIWNPEVVYCWFPYNKAVDGRTGYVIAPEDNPVEIDLGFSSQFTDRASYVLLAAYTAGKELDELSQEASQDKQILVAYIIDLIGLLVLEKTGELVKQIAEQKARELEWGVGPFLSPGSIHEWDLEEQLKLCSLLPLEQTGISIQDDAVLRPFKSLSCLIGIGIDYDSDTVGSTCQVCAKNGDCQMKQIK